MKMIAPILMLTLGTGAFAQEPATPARTAPIKTTLEYGPVITLDSQTREVAACGLEITVLRDDVPYVSTQLVQRREGERTRIDWCAGARDALQASPSPGQAVLQVRGAPRLEVPIAPEANACAPVADEGSDLLFQRLFISGGTLRIALEGQPTLSITLQRPLAPNLSRAYLNCAGDLFRPQDAGPTTPAP